MHLTESLQTIGGDSIKLGQFISAGGQGNVYEATLRSTGSFGVVKFFKSQFNSADTRRRCEFLVGASEYLNNEIISVPTRIINEKGRLGHFTKFALGQGMEEFIQKVKFSRIQALQLGMATAHAVDVLHSNQIAHGDLHSNNVRVEISDDVLIPHIIDLDNFRAPGLPPPVMIGQNLYLAPEQYRAMRQGKDASPTINTDLFSLGVLMHEILLLKHPAAGADHSEQSFEKAMYRGEWRHDPSLSRKLTEMIGGYPPQVLGPELSRLFRRSMSLEPSTRPTASEWKLALQDALDNVYLCPYCKGPFITDSSRNECDYCKKPFPILNILCPNGTRIPIDKAAVLIGRNDFTGEPTISARHAVFRRCGPNNYVESYGRNGTYFWDGNRWKRIPDRQSVAIKEGDKLKLGPVEINLIGGSNGIHRT